MAAVVGALAAFVAGCSLPPLPLPRSASQEQNLNGDEQPDKVAWCSAHAHASLAPSSSPAATPPAKVSSKTTTSCANAAAVTAECASEGHQPCAALSDQDPPGVLLNFQRRQQKAGLHRRVRFDLGRSTIHEVTPYAEVYGRHLRSFDFTKSGAAISACVADATLNRGSCNDDSDEEDDELDSDGTNWKTRPMRLLGMQPLPWHAWCAACVALLLLRAFGAEAAAGLLPAGAAEMLSSQSGSVAVFG
mmetsp:Transcript_98185/g.194460  ORF Transcript_98185/g.194460 Transcript_98185/m.194460 type:complete len:247 (+) Transcript_98185:170-910(+)|eukprot:CAMPEP_0172684730 /NCGR_PEP_ID=MMETSP1074-20121228/19765_1 /TAXON_ID=2916 /ORGANISM="Ceratium fusus, Strain PA161109" /LENGTH=246 /DNA_ID=CAMNT_0013503789 /DNA_START=169 /DNA_END=909 /DNA_ORIENTATION=-